MFSSVESGAAGTLVPVLFPLTSRT